MNLWIIFLAIVGAGGFLAVGFLMGFTVGFMQGAAAGDLHEIRD